MYKLLCIFVLAHATFAQSLDDGWKGVRPLLTDKVAVEKTFGNAEIDDNGYHSYRHGGTFIQVNFSSAPCAKDQYNRGEFTVAADTVLGYTVNFSSSILLSELKFDTSSYRKETSDHAPGQIHYISDKHSVMISSAIQGSREYVGRIMFKPNVADSKRLKCSDIVPKHR